MSLFRTIRTMKHGRIMRVDGKEESKILGIFNKKKHQELFGVLVYELTHYSDVDVIQHDMQALVDGRYHDLYTAIANELVNPVPSATHGIHYHSE